MFVNPAKKKVEDSNSVCGNAVSSLLRTRLGKCHLAMTSLALGEVVKFSVPGDSWWLWCLLGDPSVKH